MKKSFMTRILATGLSFAMAFSMAAVTSVTPASAASKPVLVDAVTGGSGRAVTVNVGEVAKLKIDATTGETYAVSSVKKSSKKIKAAVSKKGTVVYVRGVAETGEKDSAIRVFFKVKKNGKDSKHTFVSKVKVVSPKPATTELTKVTQKTANSFELEFTNDVKSPAAVNFVITRDADNAKMDVKSVVADKTDAKKLTLETFASLADGKTYTFAYTAPTEDKTESKFVLTATDGTVASVNVTPTVVTVNKKTELKYQTIDKAGVILSEVKVGEKASNIDISCTASDGYLEGSDLLLLSEGATAKVSVTYHTFKYDTTTGDEIGKVTGDFTIAATKDDTTVAGYDYTVASNDKKPNNWAKVTPKKQVAMEDSNMEAFFHVTNSKNEDITSTLNDYTVESSDDSVLIASGNVADGALLTPVKVGQAFLIVKNSDKAVVQTLSISVVAKRVLSDFTLDKTTVTIATNAAVNSIASGIIKVTAKDQYGDNVTLDSLTPEFKSASSTEAKDYATLVSAKESSDNKFISIGTDGEAKKGTYTYTVKAKKGDKELTKAFNVVVKEYKGSESYAIVMTTEKNDGKTTISEFDSTVTDKTTTGAKYVYANLVVKKNDVISAVADLDSSDPDSVSCVAIKVAGPNGKVYVNTGVAVKTADVKTSAAITEEMAEVLGRGNVATVSMTAISESSNTFTKNLPAGTYTVTYTLRKVDAKTKKAVTTPIQKSFTIKDTQAATTAVVKKTTVDTDTVQTLFEDPSCVTFTYDGANLTKDDKATCTYQGFDGTKKGNKLIVKTVTIVVPIPASSGSSNNKLVVTVPVNKVFTTNAAEWK